MINSDVAKTTYTTVPGVTEYAIGFEYYWNLDDTPQLMVTLNGEELVYGVDYTISESGLNIVLVTEPDDPSTLIITRNVPFTQTSDYVIGRIDPDQIERDFDLAMMRAQQNKVTIDTAVDIVNDCVDEVSELKSDVEATIDDVEQAVRDAETAAETAASYETRLSNVEAVIPEDASSEDLLALKSEVDLAANSGSQLTNKGVWYAKMYAATVVPTGAEYDGRNYADFSQVDGNGDPIIVLYEGQSGAWVQMQTIPPPADYNGYVTVTSKIWDIVEQNDQQGGEVLWAYNTKTFTPYPKMISFEDAALTGNSTVAMPLSSTNDNITNKGYVDTAIAAALAGFDTPELFDWRWRDATTSKATWKLADGNWINKADAETAYQHLIDDINAKIEYVWWKDANSNYVYSRYVNPGVGDKVYTSSALTTEAGEISAIGVGYIITVGGIDYSFYGWAGWTQAHDTTPSGTTVYYGVADDGHKITGPSINADSMYTEIGVAWYYQVDIPNQRFKLPHVNTATQNVQLSMPVITTETEHTTTGLPQMKFRDTSGSRPGSTQSLAVASDGGLRNAGGATASSWYGSPTNLYADPTRATGVFVGKEYLYFYIG